MKPAKRRRNARIVEAVLAVLVERYPQCFVLLESKRRPLKAGIAADVIANHPDLKPSHIGVALHRYTDLSICHRGRQRALPGSALTWQQPPAQILAHKGAGPYAGLATAGWIPTSCPGSTSKTP